MINFGVAIFLAMLAAKADPMDDARKAYNNCLMELHNKNVTAKTSKSDFEALVVSGCEVEKASYHGIIVKSERSFGSSVKDATSYADEEVMGVVESIKTSYASNLDTGATLILEK
jgi:hypothetical protein